MPSLDVQSYLNSFTNFEARLPSVTPQSFDLSRVHRLFHALGDPQKKLKFIHVAGTKGKGSTCAFAAYILRAAGYRVGFYTSPHLYHVHERIRVLEPKASATDLKDDFYGAISDQELESLVTKFRGVIDRVRQRDKTLTYFEVLTGLALCYFADRKADIVVLETGLGGRLDATNAVDALVSVITPISFDHTALLGKTLKKIAMEKAAIIKDPKSKVVIAPQPQEAMSVIQKRCRDLGIKPLIARKTSVKIPLIGSHQIENAGVAVTVVESLTEFGFKVTSRTVAQGLRQTRWPGRLEVVYKKPTVVIDCAHNTASAEVLVKSVKKTFPGKKIILVLGLSGDKDIAGVSRILGKAASAVITTQSAHPRAYHFIGQDAKDLFGKKFVLNAASVPGALTTAIRLSTGKDIVLVAGSVFIAAEARAVFKR